jgi:acyl-homoserine lactone acylase PvdQ
MKRLIFGAWVWLSFYAPGAARVMAIQGRLAEVVGERPSARRGESAIDHDRKMRTFGFYRAARVVGGKKSTTGSAILVSDPQTPVRNPSLWLEFHLSGKSSNARGVGVPGSPILLIGWNQNVAWGATALGADQADLFRLQTDPAHPDQYLFDGKYLAPRLLWKAGYFCSYRASDPKKTRVTR